LRSALGAGVASGAAKAAVRAGKTSLDLVVEVGSDVAGNVDGGTESAGSVDIDVPGVALADSADVGGVGFGVALVAEVSDSESLAGALTVDVGESQEANAGGSVPVGVGDVDAAGDGLTHTLGAVVEETGGAETASVDVGLSGGAGNTGLAVPETGGGTNALSEGLVPNLSETAGGVGHTLVAVVVGSGGAGV
jgi:hypothetical protein